MASIGNPSRALTWTNSGFDNRNWARMSVPDAKRTRMALPSELLRSIRGGVLMSLRVSTNIVACLLKRAPVLTGNTGDRFQPGSIQVNLVHLQFREVIPGG